MKLAVLIAVFSAMILAAFSGEKDNVDTAHRATFGTFGVDTSNMDTSVRPGDDFYRYVNGKWLATFKMPPDKARYGAFDALRDKSENDVHVLLNELTKATQARSSVLQKVSDFYSSWMDEVAIEALGLKPLQADLKAIHRARTKADIIKLMGKVDYTGPLGFYISPDPAESTRYVVNLTQTGLGMPNRDYYLNHGDRFDAYRAAYKTYVIRILELIREENPSASAESIIALETKLAAVHWSPERRRDVEATTNPVDRAGLKQMMPFMDWDSMLAVAGLADVQRFVLKETTALRDGVKLLDTEPVDTWKKYLVFHIANDYAPYLPKAFDEANFDFYSKALRGIEVQRDRWKRGVDLLNQQIGQGVGELYVAKYFPPANKSKMLNLVSNLRAAMGERLKTLSWMDEKTRAEARKKLATFDPRIGYPSKWRDYSRLTIKRGNLFANVQKARQFEWHRQVARLKQPVDRDEWRMNPQTVNAYYDPSMNQITFPAAILQPPFFDPNADPAVNYGAIGAVIGHEMGHGFDDQGRKFDENGKLRNWWTDETNKRFLDQTGRLAAEYNAFCPLDGVCVNGRLTMGENIGDLGGLEMALTAYKLSLEGRPAQVMDGFTGEQRFFLANAQVWRAIQRDDALRNQILTDPHAPPKARGSIPPRNMDAWYAAFDVKEGDKLYLKPNDRVKIW